MKMEYRKRGGFRYLCYPPWEDEGILHGFIGCEFDFSLTALTSELKGAFAEAFAPLFMVKQVHGGDVFKFGSEKSEIVAADAISFELGQNQPTAFGVRTADCLPIIFRSGNKFVITHAGWRGLATSIVENSLQPLDLSLLEVVVGPAAGLERYEVGSEVLEALGERARYKVDGGGKYFLSLLDTARDIILTRAPNALVVAADICTISSTEFYSFRRLGSPCPSNLGFVVNYKINRLV